VIVSYLVLITIINSIMEKELKEVADMQRRRLKKVVDPMRSILALDATGYRDYLGDRVSDHAAQRRDTKVMFDNLPWLLASCVPLSYLTKSLAIPGWYFGLSCYLLLFTDLMKHDCYFCRPSLK
jgi:hypothetical protein